MDRQDRQDFGIGLERYWWSITVLGRYRILLILSIHVNLTAFFSKIPIFRRQNDLQLFPFVGFNDCTSKAARDRGHNIGRSVKRIFGGVDDSGGCGF